MSIHSAGRTAVIVCDFCRQPCEREVFERVHYFAGKESEAVVTHFCSKECEDEHSGVNDRIQTAIDKEVRKEFNAIHKVVCPKCIQRMRRFE